MVLAGLEAEERKWGEKWQAATQRMRSMFGGEGFCIGGCGLVQLCLGFLNWYISFSLAQRLDRMLKVRDYFRGKPLIFGRQR